ncbi:MAG: lysophospholipid acyltransferase family protein, partial [Flavobacteriales bacterium]
MELISAEQLGKAMGTGNFPENINKWLMRLLKLTDINHVYRDTYYLHNEDFIAAVLEELDIRYFVDEEDLKKIPAEGPFITVSNHPFGVVDGLILLKILLSRRKDFKLMANFLLEHVEPMKEMIFSLNPFDGESAARSSFRGLKQGKLHIENQHCLGVFPAGEVSALRGLKGVGDKEWSNSIVKMVKNANVPVIPIYFHGSNSFMFHLLGLLNPKLRTARLPHEILNKSNKLIQVRIGNVIAPEEIKIFPSVDQLSTFLRAKTYALGSLLNQHVALTSLLKFKKPKDILFETDAELLQSEIDALLEDAFLFETGVYKVYCSASRHIPHLMYEIGRLREITYREVGEGGGDSLDID